MVTLRFHSFPKIANPQPVELLVGDGKAIEVKAPTNALSESYQVTRLTSWSFGKLQPARNEEEKPVFKSYGSALAILLQHLARQQKGPQRGVLLPRPAQRAPAHVHHPRQFALTKRATSFLPPKERRTPIRRAHG